MSGIKCCYQCPDRYLGCHSKCDKYIAEKKQWEEDKEKIRAQAKNMSLTSKHAYTISFMYGKGRRKH